MSYNEIEMKSNSIDERRNINMSVNDELGTRMKEYYGDASEN